MASPSNKLNEAVNNCCKKNLTFYYDFFFQKAQHKLRLSKTPSKVSLEFKKPPKKSLKQTKINIILC